MYFKFLFLFFVFSHITHIPPEFWRHAVTWQPTLTTEKKLGFKWFGQLHQVDACAWQPVCCRKVSGFYCYANVSIKICAFDEIFILFEIRTRNFLIWLRPINSSNIGFYSGTSWFKDSDRLTLRLCPQNLTSSSPAANQPSCCSCGSATYRMTFYGLWSPQTHPKDYPSNVVLRLCPALCPSTFTALYPFTFKKILKRWINAFRFFFSLYNICLIITSIHQRKLNYYLIITNMIQKL